MSITSFFGGKVIDLIRGIQNPEAPTFGADLARHAISATRAIADIDEEEEELLGPDEDEEDDDDEEDE